jgi:hypothetical protein
MKNYTSFLKSGKTMSRMAGLPKSIQVFDRRSSECDVIKIERFLFEESAYPVETIYLSKVGEKWTSALSYARCGYLRYELVPKQKNYTLQQVDISEEEGKSIIEECIPLQIEEAEKAISWCDPKDEMDEDGRYWLSIYKGAGSYRLIVSEKKILGGIYGGFHDCNRSYKSMALGSLSFEKAIFEVVKKKLGTDNFKILKANGSGTYFFLKNVEDSEYIDTKDYTVTSSTGGLHLNMEIK